jgi:flavin reductase (DIM6/NTAB) family NADH-FMN oxidoreductase RutF
VFFKRKSGTNESQNRIQSGLINVKLMYLNCEQHLIERTITRKIANKILSRKIPSKAERHFATGLSMITSRGPDGPNIMAAEWVIQISYNPMLIGIFIHEGSQTRRNIEKTKEFGVNVASQGQTTEISVAGGYSGSEIDKIKIKNVFKIIKPQKIKTPMIAGCTINAECRLVRKEKLGDHVMLVGKVIYIKHDDSKSPLIYHKGRYCGLNSAVELDRKEVKVSQDMLEFFKNLAQGKFVLKCAGVIVESKNKIMVMQWPNAIEAIPFSIPPPGKNQRDHLIDYLNQTGLELQVGVQPTMKRLVLKNGKDMQRINFVLFRGKSKKSTKNTIWKSQKHDSLVAILV